MQTHSGLFREQIMIAAWFRASRHDMAGICAQLGWNQNHLNRACRQSLSQNKHARTTKITKCRDHSKESLERHAGACGQNHCARFFCPNGLVPLLGPTPPGSAQARTFWSRDEPGLVWYACEISTEQILSGGYQKKTPQQSSGVPWPELTFLAVQSRPPFSFSFVGIHRVSAWQLLIVWFTRAKDPPPRPRPETSISFSDANNAPHFDVNYQRVGTSVLRPVLQLFPAYICIHGKTEQSLHVQWCSRSPLCRFCRISPCRENSFDQLGIFLGLLPRVLLCGSFLSSCPRFFPATYISSWRK